MKKYKANLRQLVSGILDTFSLDFAGPLSTKEEGNRFMLMAVENLSNWPWI